LSYQGWCCSVNCGLKNPPLTTWIHTLGGCGGTRTREDLVRCA